VYRYVVVEIKAGNLIEITYYSDQFSGKEYKYYSLQAEAQESSPYLKENTIVHPYRAQLVNAI
jgi:hypothetical protein